MFKLLIGVVFGLAAIVGAYWFYSYNSTTLTISDTQNIYGTNSYTLSWIPPHIGKFTVVSLVTEQDLATSNGRFQKGEEMGWVETKEGFLVSTMVIDRWSYGIGDTKFVPEAGTYSIIVRGYLNPFCVDGLCGPGESYTSTKVMEVRSEPFTIGRAR